MDLRGQCEGFSVNLVTDFTEDGRVAALGVRIRHRELSARTLGLALALVGSPVRVAKVLRF